MGTAEVVAIGNQKGGVGKTSNALHLAAALGEAGKRCLVWDMDPNMGATLALGAGRRWRGSYHVLLGEEHAGAVILRSGEDGMDFPRGVELLPAQESLELFEREYMDKVDEMTVNHAIAKPLQELAGLYDFIFLDTAPRGGALALNAYLYADWFVLCAFPEPLAFEGLVQALGHIKAARDIGGSPLRLLGLILCRMDRRRKLSRAFAGQAKDLHAFKTLIHTTAEIPNAQGRGKTLFQTKPDHPVVREFRALAEEFLERLATARTEDASADTELEVIDGQE